MALENAFMLLRTSALSRDGLDETGNFRMQCMFETKCLVLFYTLNCVPLGIMGEIYVFDSTFIISVLKSA